MGRRAQRCIKTYKSDDDMVIFQLMQGRKRLKIVHAFAYGTCHGIWLRVQGLGTGQVSMTHVDASSVKEEIACWGRQGE